MLKVSFINNDVLLIEDRDDHLVGLTAYSGTYKSITIHRITDEDLDHMINALMREEFKRQTEGK